MAKKRGTSKAGDVMYRRYYKGKPPERIAEANATMAALVLGDKIRLLREKAGLTQAQLAKKVGTQPSQISRIEDADYEGHSVDTLRRIATALHSTLRIEFEPHGSDDRLKLQPA
jgi:ribosome-binding protein aMBF1 (putative translation factor)